MAAANVKVRKVFVQVLSFCFFLVDVRGILPNISISDIRREAAEKCVIAIFPAEIENVLKTAEEIAQLFQAAEARSETPGVVGAERRKKLLDTRVTVGILQKPLDGSDNRVRIENSDFGMKDNVIIFPKVKKDRSCLLAPPNSYLSGEAYRGPISTKLLLEFINIKCCTYLDVGGELSIEGLHRKEILDTMFYMRYLTDSQTMLGLSCGNEYKNHGYCSREKSSESKSIKKLDSEKVKCNKEIPSVSSVGKDDQESSKNDQPETHQEGADLWDHHATKKYTRSNTKMAECERIPTPTKEDFLSYYLKRSRPVVIPNGAAHWPAFKKWTMDYLREMYGEKSVHIKLAPDGVFEGVESASLWEDFNQFSVPEEVSRQLLYPDLVVVRPATQNVKFSEFLDMIQNASKIEPNKRSGDKPRVSSYLEYSSIPAHFPQLESDVEDPGFIKDVLDRRHLNIWLSDGNTLGKLHFDPFDNFLCQLRGRKEVILFEPHNNTQLYEAHIPEALLGFDPVSQSFRRKKLMDSTSMVMSPVDIQEPDYERFPEFAEARPLNCTLTEGDMLFMPAFWWHEVQSYPNEIEGRNLAVNFWYEPFFTKEFPCAECKLDVNPYYRHLLHVQNESFNEDDFFED